MAESEPSPETATVDVSSEIIEQSAEEFVAIVGADTTAEIVGATADVLSVASVVEAVAKTVSGADSSSLFSMKGKVEATTMETTAEIGSVTDIIDAVVGSITGADISVVFVEFVSGADGEVSVVETVTELAVQTTAAALKSEAVMANAGGM